LRILEKKSNARTSKRLQEIEEKGFTEYRSMEGAKAAAARYGSGYEAFNEGGKFIVTKPDPSYYGINPGDDHAFGVWGEPPDEEVEIKSSRREVEIPKDEKLMFAAEKQKLPGMEYTTAPEIKSFIKVLE
jgi:hypothetical protein